MAICRHVGGCRTNLGLVDRGSKWSNHPMSRLHRTLLRALVADIAGGALPVGSRLPTEVELARSFGVSRGVARECLRSLEERGLVTVKHGSGATVRPAPEWDMFNLDVIAAVLQSDRGAELLQDYLECRRLLEIEAAALAAQRATRGHLVALSEALEHMTAAAAQTAGGPSAEDRFHDADVAFHRAVIQATGNRALGRMTEPVHRALALARRPLARPEHRLERSLPEHRRILAAIADRDPDAARAAMREHLLTVERYLSEYAAGTERVPRSAR
jgi:DNA-binding FadR family transcriptional regulator